VIEVEVPENGTVVVQGGDVHDVREAPAIFDKCWCTDGRHARYFWGRGLQYGRTDVVPHDIGIQKFELVWEIKK